MINDRHSIGYNGAVLHVAAELAAGLEQRLGDL
ncbi:uncharacterized protein METZ01_LOCUS327781, partial [marine metagenome]